MGFISIQVGGSFPAHRRQFSAIKHGHAHAVAEALAFLTNEVLPEAIERDHRLHAQGSTPSCDFDRPLSDRDGAA